MFKNRNGYWMSPGFTALFDADSGAGAGGDAGTGGDAGAIAGGADTGATEGAGGASNAPEADNAAGNNADELNAEIARLKAELAKNKDALNNATKEAGDLRKAMRSKMTQEQIDAEEKAEAAEKAAKELEELRRQVAKGNTVKTVMGKLGLDEDTAANLADHLYGASDIDNALLEIQKAWQAKEKALRKEFGKIPAPGSGADSNSPESQAMRRAQELGKARSAVQEQAQKALSAYIR